MFGKTVESGYLEFGYLEFSETRSVYLNQNYILMAFSNHTLALGTFLAHLAQSAKVSFCDTGLSVVCRPCARQQFV